MPPAPLAQQPHRHPEPRRTAAWMLESDRRPLTLRAGCMSARTSAKAPLPLGVLGQRRGQNAPPRNPATAHRGTSARHKPPAKAGNWKAAARPRCGSSGRGPGCPLSQRCARNTASFSAAGVTPASPPPPPRAAHNLRPRRHKTAPRQVSRGISGGFASAAASSRWMSGSNGSRSPITCSRTPFACNSAISSAGNASSGRSGRAPRSAGRRQFSLEKRIDGQRTPWLDAASIVAPHRLGHPRDGRRCAAGRAPLPSVRCHP